ncbi:MAG: hypothetical protein WDZ59_15970 [Pirellulales bacterium]
MDGIDRWDVVLLAIAGYVAITALARMMVRRRDQMQSQLRDEARRQGRKKSSSPEQTSKQEEAA